MTRWLGVVAYVVAIVVVAGFLVQRFAADPASDPGAGKDPEMRGIVAITADESASGRCTGLALDTAGVILTSHRCALSDDLSVEIADPLLIEDGVRLVGYDRTNHVAVIQADLSGRSTTPVPARFGDSADVKVGDLVVGRGRDQDPGEPFIRSQGTVLALDARPAGSPPMPGLVETSLDPQAVAWGGPVFDADGEVVGMTVIASPRHGTFAVPIDRALRIAAEILSGSASETVHIGAPATLGIVYNDDRSDGLLEVREVLTQGPAADGGLRIGDVVTGIDGVPPGNHDAVVALLDRHQPGDVVELTWIDRASTPRRAAVTLGAGGAGADRGMGDFGTDGIRRRI